MPFTFSHPAAVLPLNYLPKRWISLTGLVIGSMTPDFEYFIRMKVEAKYSHTWAGLFWFDLPLGLMLMMIYGFVVKNKLIDHLPVFLNRRFSLLKNTASQPLIQYLPVVIISILMGAATHLFWDSFTHPTGYFVLRIHHLKDHVYLAGHQFQVYNILQQLSSLTGAIIITGAVLQLKLNKDTSAKPIIYYWLIAVIIASLTTGLRLMIAGLTWNQYGDLIVTSISGFLVGIVVASLLTKQTSL